MLTVMCDKKNNVLFTETGCFVLSPDFKLADESQVLLKVPRNTIWNASNDENHNSSDAEKKDDEGVNKESGIDDQERPENSTQDVNTARLSINTASTNVNTGSLYIIIVSPTVTTATLEATHADFFGGEIEIDMSNITTTYLVPSTPNTRIHKDHSLNHVIGDVQSGVLTRRMTKTTNEQGFISAVYEGKTHEDLHTSMQDELLQFKLQKVWTLVDLPYGKRAIGTKWVYKNKKDERVARIEAIRLFLAYASFKDFVVYQMDVKSAFMYGNIEEEVYVCQPLGFEDLEFPDRVYKVERALYDLHQAVRAWYETLSTYLLDNGFQRVQIDKTLFIKRVKGDILLVQMSSMGELTFFLGLQVTQKDDGIFISQDKYVDEILKKFGFSTVKTTSTPMENSKPLLKDEEAKDVDVHLYRSMIGSLMYLIASRPDIMFADSPFDLEAYTDSDYASASLDRKSTTGAEYAQMMLETAADDAIQVSTVGLTYYWHFWQTATASTLDNGEMEITATIDGKVKIVTEASIRRHLKLEDSDGISNLPTTEIFEQLALMGSSIRQETEVPRPISPPYTNVADKAASTYVDARYGGASITVTSLDTGQGSGNIDKTPTMPYDLPLPRVHTLGSDEGRMQHNELMDLVTKLSDRVIALETDLQQTKKVYGAAFTKLIKKVKRLEKKDKLNKSRRKLRLVLSDEEGSDLDILAQEDPSKQGRKIAQIDEDEGITLVQMGVSTASTDFTTANVSVTTSCVEISTASPEVKTAGDSVDDIAAKSLVYIRRSAAMTKDKGKGIMEEFKSAMTKTKRQQEQERLGYEAALRLQEHLDEEERQRIAKAHKVASSFHIEEWEDIRVIIEADKELAQRLQVEEREKYSEVKKHMGSYTLQQLRGYSFDEIKSLFEATMKRVNTFTLMESDVDRTVPKIAAGSSKRDAEEELGQESSKRQKIGESSQQAKEPDELSQEELHQLMIIVPEEWMNIEALQTKYLIND
ncbi:putative ribonuclease H-like domain-containing protein [Tanacetum coccineum]